MRIIRDVEDFNRLGNGKGLYIEAEENIVVKTIYDGIVVASWYFSDCSLEDYVEVLKYMGFDFKYKPEMNVEEIISKFEEVGFIPYGENYELSYDHALKEWTYVISEENETYGVKYYKKEDLEKAIKELNS